MPIFTRTKRVTDPLDERVRNQIVGCVHQQPAFVSSGSEHSAGCSEHDDEDLLDCFLHEEYNDRETDRDNSHINVNVDNEIDSDLECDSDRTDTTIEKLSSIFMNQNVDRFRNVLLTNVLKAIEVFQSQKPNKQILNRNVMLFLQQIGYNAAVCKTKWESNGGLTSGNYEFIDVIRSDSGTRYFIDVNFAGEFDIARETEHFRRLLRHIPAVFVGKNEDLKQIVKLLTDATKRSLKTRGLLLPPWRKNRFMQNKWFGTYRRTVNYTPAGLTTAKSTTVKCRSVGFNAVNGPFVLAATRTR